MVLVQNTLESTTDDKHSYMLKQSADNSCHKNISNTTTATPIKHDVIITGSAVYTVKCRDLCSLLMIRHFS